MKYTTLALAFLLAACGSATPYVRPELALPQNWQQSQYGSPVNTDPWWTALQDENLNQLIGKVLAGNPDLAIAALKVRSARLQAGLADDQKMPTLSAGLDASRSRDLKNGQSTRSNSVSASVSYEVDLWGKLAGQSDAARWELVATQQDRESTAFSLTGSAAQLYWKIAWLNQRLRLSADNLAYTGKTLELVKVKRTAGAATRLEVLQAEQSLAAQAASHAALQQTLLETRNALALLAPDLKTDPQQLSENPLPEVPAGLPVELLARRPDLGAAENRLKKLLAKVDATRASYYPKLSLTGTLGSSSSALAQTLQNPVATLGAGLTLPFLQWNERKLNIAISETDYESAVLSFRQTLYSALADVENALSARTQLLRQGEELARNLAAAREIETLQETRYRLGSASLQIWLDAQQTRRSAEESLLENRYKQLANHATLCLALGGSLV